MLVRKMLPEDVKAVAQIEKCCFSQPWSEKSFQDSISRDDTRFLICEIDSDEGIEDCASPSKVAGYIGMYVSFDEASITNVAVSPEYRKRGIGEHLVANAKIVAKNAGANCIFLEVRVSNIPAISLYEKMGFENLGIRKNFYQHPVEDAIIMKVGI